MRLNESKSVYIDFTNKKIRQQPIFSMVNEFDIPLQRNILAWLLIPSYGGKSMLRRNVMSSTSSSGKCIVAWTQF
jgi:hypothetical protein